MPATKKSKTLLNWIDPFGIFGGGGRSSAPIGNITSPPGRNWTPPTFDYYSAPMGGLNFPAGMGVMSDPLPTSGGYQDIVNNALSGIGGGQFSGLGGLPPGGGVMAGPLAGIAPQPSQPAPPPPINIQDIANAATRGMLGTQSDLPPGGGVLSGPLPGNATGSPLGNMLPPGGGVTSAPLPNAPQNNVPMPPPVDVQAVANAATRGMLGTQSDLPPGGGVLTGPLPGNATGGPLGNMLPAGGGVLNAPLDQISTANITSAFPQQPSQTPSILDQQLMNLTLNQLQQEYNKMQAGGNGSQGSVNPPRGAPPPPSLPGGFSSNRSGGTFPGLDYIPSRYMLQALQLAGAPPGGALQGGPSQGPGLVQPGGPLGMLPPGSFFQ